MNPSNAVTQIIPVVREGRHAADDNRYGTTKNLHIIYGIFELRDKIADMPRIFRHSIDNPSLDFTENLFRIYSGWKL